MSTAVKANAHISTKTQAEAGQTLANLLSPGPHVPVIGDKQSGGGKPFASKPN